MNVNKSNTYTLLDLSFGDMTSI